MLVETVYFIPVVFAIGIECFLYLFCSGHISIDPYLNLNNGDKNKPTIQTHNHFKSR